jgi:hypothetical protein
MSIFFNSTTYAWLSEHSTNVRPLRFCSSNKYASLFDNYLKNEEQPEVKSFVGLYRSIFKKDYHSISKRLKGPCFGICMALIDFQLKNPTTSIEDIFEKHDIVKVAIFYSLIDTIRAHIVLNGKQNLTNENIEYQKQMENIASFKRKTVKTNNEFTEFNQTVREILTTLNGSVVILKIWHTLTFNQTLGHKDLKWISPHSIFICLNSSNNLIYFYDTSIKKVVKADTLESFIETFMGYIQQARSEYLSPHIIWRFESKQIERQ